MSRVLLVLRAESDRDRIMHFVHNVPLGTRVEFKEPRRTLPQNDKMWAMLTEVAEQVDWFGQKLPAEDWKILFLNGLKRVQTAGYRNTRIVPSLDMNGYVDLGTSSSDLSRDEMAQLLELIYEFGSRHFVKFKDDKEW